MKFKIFFCFVSVMMTALMFSACVDDFNYNQYGDIPEGEGDVKMQLTCDMPQSIQLGSRASGTAVEDINNLCVLIYDRDGQLYRKVTWAEIQGATDYTKTKPQAQTSPDDALTGNNPQQDQAETVRVGFTIKNLPFGQYYIYAVANMGDLDNYDVTTVANLQSIQVHWTAEPISANNQMFGYFTPNNDTSSKGFNAPLVTIRENNAIIHSWIKRTVSKVTIAYDGGGLNDNVFVYVHNVTIYDIPDSCYIGKDNTPTNDKQLINRYGDETLLPNTRFIYNKAGNIISSSQDTKGEPEDDYDKWMMLTNAYTKGELGERGSNHSATAEALYFFENMQGDYEHVQVDKYKYDKRQQPFGEPDSVGVNVSAPVYDEDGNLINDYKDRQLYGTYIEVEGYYVSLNKKNSSQGPIKYRFMLGKNTTFNYDAARNYHYKLTLGFKGWANQPDWHIEYVEADPGIEVGPVVRVSYLYNTKATLPVKLNGECLSLKLDIIENNWAPCDSTGKVPSSTVESTPAAYEFKWAEKVYSATTQGMNGVNRPYLGFLALQVPGNTPAAIPTSIIDNYRHSDKQAGQDALKSYYEGNGEGNTSYPQNTRSFSKEDLQPKDDEYEVPGATNNNWEVHEIVDSKGNVDPNSRMLLVPLWTRNKTMIHGSNFSGNNSYEFYWRKARIRLTGVFKDGAGTKTVTEYCTVYQEPRIVNPKAVWRSETKKQDFHVVLMTTRTSNAESNYTPLISEGTWKAYIEVGNGNKFLGLDKSSNTIGRVSNDTVYGKAGVPVDFMLNFKSTATADNPNFAIVTVEYHAENCVHKILVRQGYSQPTEMGGKKWSSFSLYSAKWASGGSDGDGVNDTYDAVLTKSPLAIGSFFRRGKQSAGIYAENETRGIGYQAMGATGNGVDLPNFDVANADYTNLQWAYNAGTANTYEKGYLGWRDDTSVANRSNDMGRFKVGSDSYKVPTLEDFKALTEGADFAFGVVYGDDGKSTLDTFADATGYTDYSNAGTPDTKGARAVIAYSPNTAKQVIFPLGKYGMGRRRENQFKNSTTDIFGRNHLGSLWYSDLNEPTALDVTSGNWWRPMIHNVTIAPGAVYWIDKFVDKGEITYKYNVDNQPITKTYQLFDASLGWDMNYQFFDFNEFSQYNNADACPIKLIKTN